MVAAGEKPTDQDKQVACAIADAVGPEEAHKRTGWSAKTIVSWMEKQVKDSHTHAREDFTEEDWKEQIVRTLKAVALTAASRELELTAKAEVGFVNKVRTTAIHDIQLLEGQATERTEAVEATQDEILSLQESIAIRKAKEELKKL